MNDEDIERQMNAEMAEADAAEAGKGGEDTAPEEDFLEADASAEATEDEQEPTEEYASDDEEVSIDDTIAIECILSDMSSQESK